MTARKFTRSIRVRSESFDADENTIDIVWTTGASVRRTDPWSGEDFDEVLSLEPGCVRLDRLNSGAAPFLAAHDSSSLASVIGSVVADSVSIDGARGTATVKLSRATGDRDTVQKIADGIIRSVSVGYWVHSYDKSDAGDGVPCWTATDWEPLEISAVPVPADAGAQIRSLPGGRAAPVPTSSRAAEIRGYAAKAGLRDLGEEHIRAGTSADEFFDIAAARLSGRAAPLGANMRNDQAEHNVSKRFFERLAQRHGIGAKRTPTAPVLRDPDLTPEQRRFEAERAAGEAEFRKLTGKR